MSIERAAKGEILAGGMGTTKKKFPKPKHYGEKKTFLRAEGGEKDREKNRDKLYFSHLINIF